MKITILQGAFLPVPPKMGGAIEKMWFALGKEFVRQGHEVVHISRSYPGLPAEEHIDGVLHRRLKGFETPSSGIKLKLADLIYTRRARKLVPADSDVVITNTFWAPIILPKSLRRRSMVDVQRIPKGQMRFYKSSLRLRANSNVVVEAIKSEISQEQAGKVVMVPNPLPFDSFQDVSFQQKKPLLLYAGRVHPEKGLEILIRAHALMKQPWKLQIVGPWQTSAGGGGEAYVESLRELAGNNDVEFTGAVYDMQKLNEIYAEASVFVYPSVAEMGETFGLAPLEAMAWGCVPVVSDLGCFKDFIVDNRNGLVFDHRAGHPEKELAALLAKLQQDPLHLNRLANEALKVRQSHSTPIIASEFITEFKKMQTELL